MTGSEDSYFSILFAANTTEFNIKSTGIFLKTLVNHFCVLDNQGTLWWLLEPLLLGTTALILMQWIDKERAIRPIRPRSEMQLFACTILQYESGTRLATGNATDDRDSKHRQSVGVGVAVPGKIQPSQFGRIRHVFGWTRTRWMTEGKQICWSLILSLFHTQREVSETSHPRRPSFSNKSVSTLPAVYVVFFRRLGGLT
mgnify:CR=1 FL=1